VGAAKSKLIRPRAADIVDRKSAVFCVVARGSGEPGGSRGRARGFPQTCPRRGERIYAAADAEGRIVAGRKSSVGRASIRTAAETQLPWTLYVSSPVAFDDTGLSASRRFLLAGISVMVVFLLLGGYFIARAIRREAEIAQMQSSFVSAVS